MNRQQFENRNAERWREYEQMVQELEQKRRPENVHRLPGLFRQICTDLALAENRAYGLGLSERLNDLVIRGYRFIYRGVGSGLHSMVQFFVYTFPREVRRNQRLFWLCFAMLFGPFIPFLFAAKFAPEWIELFLGEATMAQMESSFGDDATLEGMRGEFSSDFAMFGFYILNNVSIAFRIFAGGILLCVGTLFFLGYNGLHFGAAIAYVHYALNKEKFYSFVSTHSSWELLGFVIAGVAGMRIGLAILHPGRHSRRGSLAIAGKKAVTLLYGGATMIFIAAIFEGFVSASDLKPLGKYMLGIGFWIMFAAYFTFCGRRGSGAPEPTSEAP